GVVKAITIKEGTRVKQGDAILELEVAGDVVIPVAEKAVEMPTPAADAKQSFSEPKQVSEQFQQVTNMTANRPTGDVYAGPAVRKMAREIGLDLAMVPGSGPKGRIQKDDVKAFIKDALTNKKSTVVATGGAGIPGVPEVDFA